MNKWLLVGILADLSFETGLISVDCGTYDQLINHFGLTDHACVIQKGFPLILPQERLFANVITDHTHTE